MRPLDWHKKRQHSQMSIFAELILDLAGQHCPATTMTLVTKAVSAKVASNATVHQAIGWLKSHGYLTTDAADDQRLKICSITTKGKRYLEII